MGTVFPSAGALKLVLPAKDEEDREEQESDNPGGVVSFTHKAVKFMFDCKTIAKFSKERILAR